jgi:hypothetical protein
MYHQYDKSEAKKQPRSNGDHRGQRAGHLVEKWVLKWGKTGTKSLKYNQFSSNQDKKTRIQLFAYIMVCILSLERKAT